MRTGITSSTDTFYAVHTIGSLRKCKGTCDCSKERKDGVDQKVKTGASM